MSGHLTAEERHVLVVGAALAGLRTALALRREGHVGTLTVIGAEAHMPYDRPPLSKGYLDGSVEPHELALTESSALEAARLDLRLGVAATGLDLDAQRVALGDGTSIGFDRLVVATGAEPVLPAPLRGLPGVSGYRTRDDADQLRRRVLEGARVLVVGGGFVGAEIASTLAGAGHPATLVEALATPMARVLGSRLGALLAQRLEGRGVHLRCGSAVRSATAVAGGTAPVVRLVLADGSRIEADHVVVAVGVRPATAWLAGSGLDLRDGVRCDERGAAVGGRGMVYATGDVASCYDERYNGHLRVEHWTSATESATTVARELLSSGVTSGRRPLPYFWSDQCGVKIQVVGRIGPDDALHVVAGSMEDGRFLGLFRRGDLASAAVGFSMPRQLMAARSALEADPTFTSVLSACVPPSPASPGESVSHAPAEGTATAR